MIELYWDIAFRVSTGSKCSLPYLVVSPYCSIKERFNSFAEMHLRANELKAAVAVWRSALQSEQEMPCNFLLPEFVEMAIQQGIAFCNYQGQPDLPIACIVEHLHDAGYCFATQGMASDALAHYQESIGHRACEAQVEGYGIVRFTHQNHES